MSLANSCRPKLNRLKRARVVDKVTEVPASKRCEVEDEAALPASPSIHMAEASKGKIFVMTQKVMKLHSAVRNPTIMHFLLES